MRTFAAHAADLDRDRYTKKTQFDPKTKDGAQGLLGDRDASQLAKQLIARIDRNGVVPFAQAQSHIITALETLGIIERDEQKNRTTVLRLTKKGRTMVANKKAAQRAEGTVH
jgi:predicted transcriptional regulator